MQFDMINIDKIFCHMKGNSSLESAQYYPY